MTERYGIVANVCETDSCLRMGAKVWVVGGWSGGGFERVVVRGKSRGGRTIEKYLPIARLNNFRAAWVPEHSLKGNALISAKEDAVERAERFTATADGERAAHPGRRVKTRVIGHRPARYGGEALNRREIRQLLREGDEL